MKRLYSTQLHIKFFAALALICSVKTISVAQRHGSRREKDPTEDRHAEVQAKLRDAYHVAENLICRHEKIDAHESQLFFERTVVLDFFNLKKEIDRENRSMIDEELYHYLFVQFPDDFEEYLEYYLLGEIDRKIAKAEKMSGKNASVVAHNSIDAAINLINGSLNVKPGHPDLLERKKRAFESKSKIENGAASIAVHN